MIIFREKNANIVVFEKNLEARNLVVNSIRSMGFTSVTSTDQVRYAVENLSVRTLLFGGFSTSADGELGKVEHSCRVNFIADGTELKNRK